MRHDSHFVERLGARPTGAVGRQIPADSIDPSPQQPRRRFDGIAELVSSIKEKGILEPILVRKRDDRYQIIAGERRFRAAREAGLTNIPCIELDVDDRGCLEISLVENIQRRDLTPFEEADALAQLKEGFGYTHDQIARKLGRSRTTITETLLIATIPERIRKKCDAARISTRTTILQLARLPDEETMEKMIAAIQDGGLNRDDVRRLVRGDDDSAAADRPEDADRPGPGSGAGFIFRYRDPERPYSFTLKFPDRKKVPRRDLIKALEEILRDLKASR